MSQHEEITATPVALDGTAVAMLRPNLYPRTVKAITVSSDSAAQTNATVHLTSPTFPPVAGTVTGNGDTAGGSPLSLPKQSPLYVKWAKCSPGAVCTAIIEWDDADAIQ